MIHERLLDIIQYKTSGKQADFAEIMGWSPQYLNRLTKGESGIGIRPIVALLEKFPELNARWLLLGEGAMITSAADEVRKRLAQLLEIETVSYTHLRAHETPEHLVCRLLLEKKKKRKENK